MGKSSLPFKYEEGVHEGHVSVFCEDRAYGIKEILVPKDFWSEGKFLLRRVWGVANPVVHSAGFFQEINEVSTFHFSPATANVSNLTRILRGVTNPVFVGLCSIKCLVIWPEMNEWRARNDGGGGMDAVGPLETDSPARYLLAAMGRNEITAIPFGHGPMVLGHKAELTYLAHAM